MFLWANATKNFRSLSLFVTYNLNPDFSDQNRLQHPLGRGQRSSTMSQWTAEERSRQTFTSDIRGYHLPHTQPPVRLTN